MLVLIISGTGRVNPVGSWPPSFALSHKRRKIGACRRSNHPFSFMIEREEDDTAVLVLFVPRRSKETEGRRREMDWCRGASSMLLYVS
jgi:hypothetical protein